MKKLLTLFSFILAILLFAPVASFGGVTKEIPYASSSTVTPNVLIMLDNSGSMTSNAYTGAYVHDPTNNPYYGYFNPLKQYKHGTNIFEEESGPLGVWNGNFLNWLTMRRIDVAIKVLVGGKANPRPVNKLAVHTLVGSTTSRWSSLKTFDNDTAVANLYAPSRSSSASQTCHYDMVNGNLLAYENFTDWLNFNDNANYTIKVAILGPVEGVIQKVDGTVRLGLEYFNEDQGGFVDQPITDPPLTTDFYTAIENMNPDTWTPLGEAFYTAAGYFGGYTTDSTNGPKYFNAAANSYSSSGTNADPFDFTVQNDVSCAKTFVLMITDGEPTQDQNISSTPFIGSVAGKTLTDWDNDSDDPGTYSSNGSDYLDDVALWAHTTDLRTDLSGTQNITLFTVFAFGSGSDILKNAAVNGGFVDADGDNLPDPPHPSDWSTYTAPFTANEWDENADGVPDYYYAAETGSQLEDSLISAFNEILAITNAVTAPVVMPGAPGTGNNLYSATFVPDGKHQWEGHLKKFPLDSNGFLQGTSPNFTTTWNAGDILGDDCTGTCVSSTSRKIFTRESTVTASTDNIVEANWSDLMPLLGTNVTATRTLLGYDSSSDPTYELSTKKLINFIRGKDVFDEDVDSILQKIGGNFRIFLIPDR